MIEELERSARSQRFRSAIAAFIEARRDAKLKGRNDDTDAVSKYEYSAWLADAARRVGQIQAVTHVLKATHPDARGSSLHVAPQSLPQRAEIGSHVLGDNFAEDVVGNAAALDVFKFLKVEVDGRRLLEWMQAGDPDLQSALHRDPDTAAEWMTAFRSLVRTQTTLSSHEVAKQVYWLSGIDPTDDADFHLLQPMFSSSLAHAVHGDIREARFGEPNKLARHAHRAKQAHDGPYRDYRNLVARKLGGTKPQNISQLNSERGGVNYLLASLPPSWKLDQPKSLLGLESALQRFAYFPGVRQLVRQLAAFLLVDPDGTMETRDRREILERAIGDELPVFAASFRARLPPGWTREPGCELPECEQLWLDPERTELPPRVGHEQEDADFATAYDRGDWVDQVAERFGKWLNTQLRDAGINTLGDAEHRHWARQAVVDAVWPVPLQRRAPAGASG